MNYTFSCSNGHTWETQSRQQTCPQCGKEAIRFKFEHNGFLMVEKPEREGWEQEGQG